MTDPELFERTRDLMNRNMIRGQSDGVEYHYTRPSPDQYPYQYFWDTCFHVFIFTALGEDQMAKEHLLSLFSLQEKNGFVGHMIYRDRLIPGRVTDIFQSRPGFKRLFRSHMSSLVQPPLAAQSVERIFEKTGDTSFLRKMIPRLKNYYRWLARHRDLSGDGLLTIISPFESGMDWKPTYDEVLGFPHKRADWRLFVKEVGIDVRNYLQNYDLQKISEKGYFLVKDAGTNTIYAQNLLSLARLCQAMNDRDAGEFTTLGSKVSSSILREMYNEEDAAFYDVYGKENVKIRILTPTIFYPIVLDTIPAGITDEVLNRHLFNDHEFNTPYPIPSVAINDASFNPHESIYIWRGPTWIVHNWFLHQVLQERGYTEASKKMVDTIRSLISASGFREYYNPFTGEGYGARDFTWSGLVVDMIRMEREYSG